MGAVIRPYQERAISAVVGSDVNTVLVCPTGGGKSFMAAEIIRREGVPSLCLAHRREIVDQMRATTGVDTVTIQGLLRGEYAGPPVELLVIDECHHIIAEEWEGVLRHFPRAKIVGLTATPHPELSRVFKRMVVAAYHSELVADGYLSPCEVFQPPGDAEIDGVAQHPVEAYLKYGEGQAFMFAPTVALSKQWADDFSARGISAEHIDGTTPKAARDATIQRFRDGKTTVLSNVDILTEGFDAPGAITVILGKRYGSLAAYLQATGRGLRVADGKEFARIIDLTGCTHVHGFPTDDRVYELGQEIRRKETLAPLRNCPVCGFTQYSVQPRCGRCGHVYEKDDPRVVKIQKVELQRARRQGQTEESRLDELRRWVDRANTSGTSYYVLSKHYQERYGVKPELSAVCTDAEKRAERSRLVQRHGYGKGLGMWKGLFQ